MNKALHVAVGVIQDARGNILIARRPEHLHQGGLWEFPGGKVEAGEDVISALQRELQEELDIIIEQTHPLISIEHDYPDRKVLLDVHRVTAFQGQPRGCEGQAVSWVSPRDLDNFKFPAANRGILNAVRLPDRYLITGEFSDDTDCLNRIQNAVDQGVSLIQLRANHLTSEDYLSLARKVTTLQTATVQVLLNTEPTIFVQTSASGLHLNRYRLMQYTQRPVADDKLLSASVHNEQELAQANRLAADMILLSPVLPTTSHPSAKTLGWDRFAELAAMANCPVYALGGMRLSNISQACSRGAQGIAGIQSMWCGR